jgi:hypothetical protein
MKYINCAAGTETIIFPEEIGDAVKDFLSEVV